MVNQCPNCKNNKLKVITRKSYLLIAFLYLITGLIVFLISQFTPRLNSYVVLLLAALTGIAIVAFIVNLIFAAMQLSPTYRCKFCGYQFWGRSQDKM